MFFLFFFFKQKTAYEMRISDWSSDVCSSDLAEQAKGPGDKRQILRQTIIDRFPLLWIAARGHQAPWLVQHEIDLAPCADRTAVDRDVCKREIHPLARGLRSAPTYTDPASLDQA